MYWDDDLLAAADAALARAASVAPTTLLVEGDPGTGKSSLLDEIAGRAHGFHIMRTEAFESAVAHPYDVLIGLGAGPDDRAGAGLSPVLGAQRLRAAVDEIGGGEPVLVVVDDLQWADAESVEALVSLMSHAAGDRLLLCVGCRPLGPEQLATWRRWAARPDRVERLVINGLGRDAALALIHEIAPATGVEVATRLWEHTSGNPLYLRALVADYATAELAQMRVLPAPAEFSHSVAARLARLSADAQQLAEALAVLGGGWSSELDLASLAAVASPSHGIQELASAGLVETRSTGAADVVRPAHSLVQAAVYQAIPGDRRRALHAEAAGIVTAAADVLNHRAAAVERYDETLADDLEVHAASFRERRSFRLAAHYLRAASSVTASPPDRERRWLAAMFDTMMSGDREAVRAARADIGGSSDARRRDLVLSYLALIDRRPLDSVQLLTPWSTISPGDEPPDDNAQYRIEALLAWCLLTSGADEQSVREALDRASRCAVPDVAVGRLAMMAAGQLAGRHANNATEVPLVADLPDLPAAVPAEMTSRLGWRGIVRVNSGQFAAAAADLTEVTDRMQRGLQEFSSGTFHSMLARAQWFSGSWALARMNFRLADELGADSPHPLVLAARALLPIGDGDVAAADQAIADARATLDRGPWPEAIDTLTAVTVIRQHAIGPSRSTYAAIRPTVWAVRDGAINKPLTWTLHAALAAIWAGELDDARACIACVERAAVITGWTGGAAAWLRGLVAEAAGDGKAALGHLRSAVSADLSAVPLYAAHAHLDHARVAHLMGDTSAATRSLDLAAQTYQALGAAPYLAQINEIRRTTTAAHGIETLSLSDRERDVLTLVTSGMSYAQIARDLFITQSTVSYHLGNIYAKANVSSRHQLTQLVREQPASFGLASA